ncbi:hypothetical protein, partial [Escherichia coli]|uniref:hypothetical protein n=1 Tax=Escherichia coli TaxID=562 RepID=UPI00159BB762
PRPLTISADVTALGALGLGGSAGGLGGEGSLRWWVFPTTALRVAAGLRVGDMPAAKASTTVARLALGVASQVVEGRGSHPSTIGLRLDLPALRHSVTSSTNVSGGARWVPGVDAAIEGSWAITSR